jgi:arabinan endo-1,5-alpha-L-arabinosidase
MRTYTNPVLDLDFPDPSVLRAADGQFYAYATQTVSPSRILNIQVSRSSDLAHWSEPTEALPVKPSWARTTQDFWSPCVERLGSTYVMYYAARADDGPGLGLGVATARDPLGPFEDSGRPLVCGDGFINIDPMAFHDPNTGKHLLYWGSGFEPIKVQELTSDRRGLVPDRAAVDLIFPCEDRRYERLVEGVFVHYREPYYYLFYSGDDCFSPDQDYAVMVARSTEPAGPFETLAQATNAPHSAILEANTRWGVPGHNSIVTDAAGQDWIVYHAVDLRRHDLRRFTPAPQHVVPRVMCIDRLEYRDGWPCVPGGAPSTTPRRAPVVDSPV